VLLAPLLAATAALFAHAAERGGARLGELWPVRALGGTVRAIGAICLTVPGVAVTAVAARGGAHRLAGLRRFR
jgi:hypothetical protein